MWKVLIVEDEIFVRESIKEIINWQELGYKVVGEAGTGKEALGLIVKFNPDLVLTDIIMPEMDGLELLRKTREMGYASRFVMLTCMGEFDYIRQAMEYGASNYILKLSMSVQSLRDTLDKISIELRHRESPHNTGESYSKIWDMLYANEAAADGFPSIWHGKTPYRRVSIFSILHCSSALNAEDLLVSLNSYQGIAHTFSAQGITTFFYWSIEELPWNADLAEQIKFPYAHKLNALPHELTAAWRMILRKLNLLWYGLSEKGNEMQFDPSFSVELVSWDAEKSMLRAFELGDGFEFEQIVDEVWNTIKQQQLPMPLVKINAKRLVAICCRIAKKPMVNLNLIENATSHTELKKGFVQMISQLLPVGESLEMTDHPEINKIISYVHNHYHENITVKAMADLACMDENYVSGLFKRKIGKNLITYIHEVRITSAMQLLLQTNMSVNEICQKVGFANDNYFIKIFKRITNYTPSEYRKNKV
jgi:two-component system response regulator YesN